MNRLRAMLAATAVLTLCLGVGRASADQVHEGDINAMFQDVSVSPNETVNGNVNVVFGDATVAGTVNGDCNAVFGSCEEIDGGQILGRTNSVTNDAARAFVPLGITAMADQDRRLIGNLASSAVVVLVFLLFPMRMRVALARVERHPALSGLVGAVGAVAVIPLAVLLIVSLVGIPLVLLEAAALFAGVWIGTGAIALLVGRRLCELAMPASTPSPLLALILGLVVVSAAEIVPIVGWIVTALVWLIGLGAAILTLVRSTQLDDAVARAPIGGPPMTGRGI